MPFLPILFSPFGSLDHCLKSITKLQKFFDFCKEITQKP